MKKKHTQDWTEILPRGTAGRIKELIPEDVDISERTIQRILKGESEDSYGILTIAAEMSKERIRSNEKLMQDYSLLKLKQAQPLKSK